MRVNIGRIVFFIYVGLALIWCVWPTAITLTEDFWYYVGQPGGHNRICGSIVLGLIVYFFTIQLGTNSGRM